MPRKRPERAVFQHGQHGVRGCAVESAVVAALRGAADQCRRQREVDHAHRSRDGPVDSPSSKERAVQLLQELLEGSAQRLAEKVALVCQQQRITYGELDARANRLAHSLRRLGVERGDRVVIFAVNTVETVTSIWGALKADAAKFWPSCLK